MATAAASRSSEVASRAGRGRVTARSNWMSTSSRPATAETRTCQPMSCSRVLSSFLPLSHLPVGRQSAGISNSIAAMP
jgi:hypothetical protein